MTPRPWVLVVLVAVAPVLGRAQGQQPSSIHGRVVAESDARPIANARIVIVANGQSSEPIFADSEGRFTIATPPPGSILRAAKAGYGPVDIARPAATTSLDVRLPAGAALTGRVVDASGQPVVDVVVRLTRDDAGSRSAVVYADTDDRGEYRLGSLAPGRYVVDALGSFDFSRGFGENLIPGAAEKMHATMLQQRVNARPMSGATAVSLRAGDEIAHDIVYRETAVSLPYAEVGGAIAGVLVDEFGELAEGVVVRPWQVRVQNGKPLLRPAGRARRSDDRGRYRLYHLPAGRYYLTATADSDPASIFVERERFLPVFFPGSPDVAEAWPIDVARASEAAGTDMAVPRNRGASIRGIVLDGDGSPMIGTVALIAATRRGAPGLNPRFVESDARGGFEFAGVAPGTYVVQAARLTGGDAMHVDDIAAFAMQRVQVGTEAVGPVTLTATATSSLTGRVVFDGGVDADAREFGLAVLPVDPDETPSLRFSRPDVAIEPDGEFAIKGLTTRIRLGLERAPEGWWIKSAYVGGIDAAEIPVAFGTRQDSRDGVRVVLARTAATVSGRVTNDGGDKFASSVVVVFPSDADRRFRGSRYVRTADTDSDGRFTITSLPPGSYLVTAVEAGDGEAGADWTSAEALDSLMPRAERLTLGERQALTLSLRVVRLAR